jgi:spermidine synthase
VRPPRHGDAAAIATRVNQSKNHRRFRDTFTPGETIEYDIVATLHESKSRWQEIAIHEFAGHGRTLVLDGNIQSAEADEHLYHEALVQPAMLLAADAPRRVLVLGGGEGATLREVLKHRSVTHATMVDLDRAVIDACREHLPRHHRGSFDDPRTELVIADAAEYVAGALAESRFDVIISDVVDPNEAPAKHLFSREFFTRVRRLLDPGGVFAAQIGPAFAQHFDAGARAVADLEATFPVVYAGAVFVPVYLSPWGFAIGCDHVMPAVAELERRIGARLAEPPRSLAASDISQLLALPKELRDEIAAARSGT